MTTNNELLTALENERRYVASELHDDVAQTALQLGLQIGICNKLLERNKLEMLAEQLSQLEERAQLVSTQVRAMITDMRTPSVEETDGISEYLQQIIEIHHQRNGAVVTYRNRLSAQSLNLPLQQMLTVSRIVQEALMNIRKHAEAKNILLDLFEDSKYIYVTIADDGKGFNPAEISNRQTGKGGAGLANLYARAKAMGATLKITKGTMTGGTSVVVALPK